MKKTEAALSLQLHNNLEQILFQFPLISKITQSITDKRGTALLVGGAVRDLLLGLPIKDLDIEVHGLSVAEVEEILKKFGPVDMVGKSFGVLRVHPLDVDWSLPRTDSAGRKPEVTIDPNMDYAQAFKRRDLTINAMGIDLKTFELIDPYNGLEDLHNKVLRAPDLNLFVEDPLRFYRVMQFIARFNMHPDAQLTDLAKKMDIAGVSRERIESEFYKMLLKSKTPSLGLRWLQAIGRLHEILPELADLVGLNQSPQWHPEGDVFEHTMQAVDAAARFAYENNEDKLLLMYAALCHDLGKKVATQIKDGAITNHGHDVDGVPLAKKMLTRITHNEKLIKNVCTLVRWHMMPVLFFKQNSGAAAYKRLAHKMAPLSLQQLADLSIADQQGRNPVAHTPLDVPIESVTQFVQNAQHAGVLQHPEPAILTAHDIMNVVAPGPELGKLLAHAYELQIEKGITDTNELKKLVLEKK